MITTSAMAATGDASSRGSNLKMVEVEAPASGGDRTNGGGGEEAKVNEQLVTGRKRRKGKSKGWSEHKGGAKSRGKEDTERRAKVNDKIERVMRARENLDNPYDDMDLDTKKAHALFLYNDKMAKILADNEVAFSSKSVSVKKKVAKRVGVSKRTVARWVLEYLCDEEVWTSNRGKHSKCHSPIDDAEFRASFCQYVRCHAKQKGNLAKILIPQPILLNPPPQFLTPP